MRRLSLLAAAAAVAAALGGCQQTVMLGNGGGADGAAGGDGGQGIRFCSGGRPQSLDLAPRSPDVVFSVDRATSMQTAFDTGTRLSVAQDILTGLVLQYQAWVRFAYEEFPAPEGCASSGACCAGDPTNPMLSASNSITYAMHACERSPGGCALSADRPIAAALDQSRQVFYTNFDAGVRGRYIVLVTDGDPSCFADSDTLECSNANASAVSLVNDNIKTFVVGEAISNSSCLDQLALSGGAERQGGAPFFYPAGTKSQLSEFLTDIISQIASDACQIDVHQPSDPTSQLALYLKGIQIPRDDTNGWDFDASTPWKITINGSWCQMLLAASPSQLEIDACPQH